MSTNKEPVDILLPKNQARQPTPKHHNQGIHCRKQDNNRKTKSSLATTSLNSSDSLYFKIGKLNYLYFLNDIDPHTYLKVLTYLDVYTLKKIRNSFSISFEI
jgi:hypothetical protein